MKSKKAFSDRTYVMGVLNVTPDSFSDGGRFFDRQKALAHALEMARDGADIIDVGGESTRPGSNAVSVEEELGRVIPVISRISKKAKVAISIDTRKSKVAEEAVRAGASIINDISGLRHDPKIASVAAKRGARLILMHMKGAPKDMQAAPRYKNLMKEIINYFKESIDIAKHFGVPKEDIIVDPGIGFGKTLEHNLEILNRLDELKALGCPICVGTSRKSFIGKTLGISRPDDRLAGTLATCAIAIMKGANIMRVHDVREAVQLSRMVDSVSREKGFSVKCQN